MNRIGFETVTRHREQELRRAAEAARQLAETSRSDDHSEVSPPRRPFRRRR